MRLSRLLCSSVSAIVRAFPLTGEGRLPLSGGDVERSETEGVGDLAAGQGTDLELREELLIGSSPACGIVFASGGIEPQHARVLLSGGTVCLEDLGGGTLVNGIPVTAPAALRSGDEISVGEAAFRLKF